MFSPIFGKLLKSLHCIKTVHYLTDPIIAQYQFWLLSQKFLSVNVHQTFYYFLSQHDLLLDSQFGFRSSRSCELAIADLSDNILTDMDNKLLNGLLLVDLKKAFDLVDHDTLLNKLRIYGCSHSTMVWFRSYVSERSQKTQSRSTLSEALPVSVGVPQGSILGPLFFIIHIDLQISHMRNLYSFR